MLAAHGVTHIGLRKTNEDAMVVDPALGLFVVADGMGGHNAGEVASAIAVRAVYECVATSAAEESVLSDALTLANERVLDAADAEADYAGMGTTVVAAFVKGTRLLYGSVGDSRIYLWRAGALTQLTTDDSWLAGVLSDDGTSTESVLRHPMRHVLTKVVGLRDDLEPSVGMSALAPGDVVLLCSDGLHGVVADTQIAELLGTGAAVPDLARRLVDLALAAGASDNVTVIVVRAE